MFIAYAAVTSLTIVANAAIAGADLRRAKFVVANSTEVGVRQSWLPLLATLKGAGAAGLLLGLIGVSANLDLLAYLGVAAAIGLTLFFAGALIAHLRALVFYNLYYPGTYWLLAIASLVLAIAVL